MATEPAAGSLGAKQGQKGARLAETTAAATPPQTPQPQSGQGAQFIYAAATVANILCESLTPTQINLLASFLSVVTTCVYAVLTVENPSQVND